MNNISSEQILSLLPQTQCTKCGYASCRDYAKAIKNGAAINCCPTGGKKGIERLAALTGQPFTPLNPEYGVEQARNTAMIDESLCIGCRLCIKACPVDAIIGSSGFTHTVLQQKCTGCDLCLPACPVDCIIMKNVSGKKTGWNAWSSIQAQRARFDYELRIKRLERKEKEKQARLEAHTKKGQTNHKKAESIFAAIEKARAKSAKNI